MDPTPAATADPIRYAVTTATRRLRQRRALRFGATGLLIGSVVGFGFAAAITYNLLRETTLPGGGAFLFLPSLAGLLAGALHGVLGKYDPVSVARLLERRLDLKDRLSTALGAKPDGSPVVAAQESDASHHAPDTAAVYRAVPLTPVPRRTYIALAVAVAVALTYFAPELPVVWNPKRRAEQVAVKKEGERLLAVAKAAAAEAKKQNLPEAEKAAKKVEALGKELARGRMPLKEALLERAKLSEELRKAQDKITREQTNRAEANAKSNLSATGKALGKTLQGSGTTPNPNPATGSADARMKALQDALARGDKNGVANALREMADAADRGEPKPGAERNKTGQQLTALGDALGKNNLSDAGRSAESAGEAMRRDAMPDAAQSLRDAAEKIEQSAKADGASGGKSGSQQQAEGGNSNSGSGQQAGEKSALQKIEDQIRKLTGQEQQNSGGGGGQVGQQNQSSQGNPSQSGGQQGQAGAQGQSGQSGQGQQSGQGGAQSESGKSTQSGGGQNSGGKQNAGSGSSNSGQGQSQGAGKGKGSGGGKGGSGAGSESSGNARTENSAQRLGKNAREQNVRGKKSGEGPETVITETDRDRTGLPASSLPYYREFVKQRKTPAGEAAQSGESVPNAYRNQVRGYFDALPGNSGAKGQ